MITGARPVSDESAGSPGDKIPSQDDKSKKSRGGGGSRGSGDTRNNRGSGDTR